MQKIAARGRNRSTALQRRTIEARTRRAEIFSATCRCDFRKIQSA
jgi:hypothetical protein